jgi:selenocysteine-specific elongation factor
MTVIATAGHVDHGKSTLVNFLTGQETDKLAEEKSRGLTINLGYTFYKYGDQIISIVDVPGHRDFFKNTVAGFSNADAVLFVIDSTQGWAEQSEQHFNALISLSKLNILFIFTKLDMKESNVDEQWLIDKVSNIKNLNYKILKFDKNSTDKVSLIEDIQTFLSTCTNEYSSFWIDRSFLIDGIGRIVTGTVGSGFSLSGPFITSRGEKLEVKNIESVYEEYTQETGSQRVAVSLKKSSGEIPKRGDLLSNTAMTESIHIFIKLDTESSKEIRNNTLKLFAGTSNHLVEKIHPLRIGDETYAIAKLGKPAALPMKEKMALHNIDRDSFIPCEFTMPVNNKNLIKHLIRESKKKASYNTLYDLLYLLPFKYSDESLRIGQMFTDEANLNLLNHYIKDNAETINKFGIKKYLLEKFYIEEADIQYLFAAFEDISVKENQIKLNTDNTEEDKKVLKLISNELGRELKVPDIDLQKFDREVVKNLFLKDKLIRISKNILYTDNHFQELLRIIEQLPATFTIAEFKSLSGLSRKYTIPILEILDSKQIIKKIDSEGTRVKLIS